MHVLAGQIAIPVEGQLQTQALGYWVMVLGASNEVFFMDCKGLVIGNIWLTSLPGL